jgi:hypothetical protein
MLRQHYYKSLERNDNETQIEGGVSCKNLRAEPLKPKFLLHIFQDMYNIPVTVDWLFIYVPKTVT